MSRGPSGRIVVEVDPALKKRLHAALTLDGITLKHWFRKQAVAYLTGIRASRRNQRSRRRRHAATQNGSQMTIESIARSEPVDHLALCRGRSRCAGEAVGRDEEAS